MLVLRSFSATLDDRLSETTTSALLSPKAFDSLLPMKPSLRNSDPFHVYLTVNSLNDSKILSTNLVIPRVKTNEESILGNVIGILIIST